MITSHHQEYSEVSLSGIQLQGGHILAVEKKEKKGGGECAYLVSVWLDGGIRYPLYYYVENFNSLYRWFYIGKEVKTTIPEIY